MRVLIRSEKEALGEDSREKAFVGSKMVLKVELEAKELGEKHLHELEKKPELKSP